MTQIERMETDIIKKSVVIRSISVISVLNLIIVILSPPFLIIAQQIAQAENHADDHIFQGGTQFFFRLHPTLVEIQHVIFAFQ